MYSFLRDLTVLDLTRLMPGAITTLHLAAFGANVIKIEQPPSGDYMRNTAPLIEGAGDLHLALNGNKRSLGLDLREKAGLAVFHRLLARARVVVTSSRADANRLLSLDFDSVVRVRPDVIYCAITGWGDQGPMSNIPAHGLNMDVAAGLVEPLKDEQGLERLPLNYVPVGSRVSGFYAAIAILAALQQSTPAYIDISSWQTALAWNFRNITTRLNLGQPAPSIGALGPRYDVYRTSDNRLLLLTLPERKFWENFCMAADRSDLLPRGRFASELDFGEDDPGLADEIAETIAGKTLDEWVVLLRNADVAFAPFYSEEEALTSEFASGRHVVDVVAMASGARVTVPAYPTRVDGADDGVSTVAPMLGEHTTMVLKEAGFTAAEVKKLRTDGIVS